MMLLARQQRTPAKKNAGRCGPAWSYSCSGIVALFVRDPGFDGGRLGLRSCRARAIPPGHRLAPRVALAPRITLRPGVALGPRIPFRPGIALGPGVTLAPRVAFAPGVTLVPGQTVGRLGCTPGGAVEIHHVVVAVGVLVGRA